MTIINKEFQGRIIGYARVSTRDQNLDMQLDVLQRQDCVQIFCEKISGVKKRPELEHCLSLLREGDVLVVYKLDRLARSLSEIVRQMRRSPHLWQSRSTPFSSIAAFPPRQTE